MSKLEYNYYINNERNINSYYGYLTDNNGTTINYYWCMNKNKNKIVSDSSRADDEYEDKSVLNFVEE